MRETRHAIRRLARDWQFTLAAILILGLGIGANTAIFSASTWRFFASSRLRIPTASSTSWIEVIGVVKDTERPIWLVTSSIRPRMCSIDR